MLTQVIRQVGFDYLIRITFILLTGFFSSCGDTSSPVEVKIIPTSTGIGPGGPAYLAGNIKDFVNTTRAVSNTDIYILKQQDYSDTLIQIYVNSSDASFRITNMPVGSFDLIFENAEYFCAKIGKLNLNMEGNSFYNPFSNGYFIDSTILMTNIADSVGRLNAPQYGLQGYVPELTVHYKSETPDSIGWNIVLTSDCDTIAVYRYDDPVFDPYENDVYRLKWNDLRTLAAKFSFFNWHKEVLEASPNYKVISK